MSGKDRKSAARPRFESVRGMRDLLPDVTPLWAAIEATFRDLLSGYGYHEMRVPIIEYTQLFRRSIGEVTDIVEKEMYTFDGRDGDSLTLRPEATAGFVRAAIEHGLLHNQTQRLWCIGPMFRYERPQAGRYRQFHQLDVEAFGLPGPDIDAELICLLARAWKRLGLSGIELQLNSLGSPESRAAYRDRLIAYFEGRPEALDEDSRRRLHRNPLRILDSKNPQMTEVIAAAPQLADHLDDDARRHFDGLRALLDAAGVPFTINPRLVRGLDYYNKTVFEWVAVDGLGSQNTVCGGGRYDGLVGQLGGRETPGIGFGLGLERLVMMLAETGAPADVRPPHAYLVTVGAAAGRHGLALAERLRDRLPALRLTVNAGGGNFKSQFKRADRSGALCALIIGDDEVASGRIGFKPLRDGQDGAAQSSLGEGELLDALRRTITAQDANPSAHPPPDRART